MWHYEWEFLIVCHYSTKFGGHRNCGSGDSTFFICHVILQDHVIEGLCVVMGGTSSLHVTILQKLVAIGIVVVKI